jgi:hypothetical protein
MVDVQLVAEQCRWPVRYQGRRRVAGETGTSLEWSEEVDAAF